MFFSFDGVDGTGKSTQIQLFSDWLRRRGREVVVCRDPGSTALGESLREIVLGNRLRSMHMRSEMLIYMAARAQLVEEVIRPALARAACVVSDRFLLANIAYQAYAGDLNVEEAWAVGHFATDRVEPDRTFLLDMDPAAAAKRIERERDRLEKRSIEYFARVRNGFLNEAAQNPEEITVVDADQTIDQVHRSVCEAAQPLLS